MTDFETRCLIELLFKKLEEVKKITSSEGYGDIDKLRNSIRVEDSIKVMLATFENSKVREVRESLEKKEV